jgi:phospholipid/cholesterol/gamma-HCH transport system substrate-binding protein
MAATKKETFMTPFKVGVFVVASIAAFVIFLQFVSTRGISSTGSYTVYALFDDVLGLEKQSPVQIAGIDIGHIKDVQLFQGKAKVFLEIDGKVELYEDAAIEKVSISLLGDYKLAVEPGSANKRKLVDGDEIKNVKSLSDVDAIVAEVRSMSEAMKKMIAGTPENPAPLERIVADVQGSAAAARIVLEEVSKNIGDNTDKLDRIMANIERFTSDLTDISEGRDKDFDQIVQDAKVIASALRRTSENIDKIVGGQDQQEISDSVKGLKQTLETMNRALENVASITKKIDDGEGTVGKLVNDPSIHDDAAEAVEGINAVVGGLSRLQTWVNLRSEFQFRTGSTKNYVQFILMPKEDKGYIFEVVDDPRGVRETVITDVESTSPEDGRQFQYRERRTTTTDGLNFSLMFMKRFYWLSLRFGIIEGTGGVGADIHFLDDRLELLLDLNRFGEEARRPRIKGLALIEVIPHIYVHGGVDDPLNPGTVDYFMGMGIRFNDEDLKTLLTATGGIPSGSGN